MEIKEEKVTQTVKTYTFTEDEYHELLYKERKISKNVISIDEAKKKLNKNLNIQSEGMAMIPTEFKTEILCYEFKGKINDSEFLVYINAETGDEEDILIVYNS